MTASLARSASLVIAETFESNDGSDAYLKAAAALDDRRMLLSPQVAADIAATERARVLELMRGEIADLERERTDAGIRLTLSWMSAVLDRIEATR